MSAGRRVGVFESLELRMDELVGTVNSVNSRLENLERNLVAPLLTLSYCITWIDERTRSLEVASRSAISEDVAVQTAPLVSCDGREVCPLDDPVEGAGSPVTATGTVDPPDIASSPDIRRFIFHRVGSCPELRSCASSVPRLPADPVPVAPTSCVPRQPVDSSLHHRLSSPVFPVRLTLCRSQCGSFPWRERDE